MKRILVLVIVLVSTSLAMGNGTYYYIPHVAGSSAWETYLILDNHSTTEQAHFSLSLYDDTERVYDLEDNLDPRETRTISLRELGGIMGHVRMFSSQVRVRIGYVAREDTGGGTAEFDAPTQLLDNATFSLSGYTDILTWSGFAICNHSYDEIEVSARINLRNGTTLNVEPFAMGPREKKVNYFNAEFGIAFEDIASVIFYTDDPVLAGVLISGMENERLLFTIAQPATTGWEMNSVTGSVANYLMPGGQALLPDNRLVVFNGGRESFDDTWSVVYNALTGDYITTATLNNYRIHQVLTESGRVFLLGEHDYDYFIGEWDVDTGTFLWESALDDSPGFATYKRAILETRIHGAVHGDTMMVCLSLHSGHVKRYLINVNTGATLDSREIESDNLLGDVFYQNGYFYYFRVYRSGDENTPYTKVSLYYNPTNSLSGGGKIYTLPDMDPEGFGYLDATGQSVVQSGTYVDGNTLYVSFQYSTVNEFTEADFAGRFYGPPPGVVVLATIDLNTRNMTWLVNTFHTCQFGARTKILEAPSGVPLAFVASRGMPDCRTVIVPFNAYEWTGSYIMWEPTVTINMALIDPIVVPDNGDLIYGGTGLHMEEGAYAEDYPYVYRNRHGRRPFIEFLNRGPYAIE